MKFTRKEMHIELHTTELSDSAFLYFHIRIVKKQHWISRKNCLPLFSTSCGCVSYFTDQNPIVRNNVYLKFAPGSELYGASLRLPIACKFQAGFPGLALVANSNDDDDDDDITLERIGGGDDEDQDYSDGYESISDEREVKSLPENHFSTKREQH